MNWPHLNATIASSIECKHFNEMLTILYSLLKKELLLLFWLKKIDVPTYDINFDVD